MAAERPFRPGFVRAVGSCFVAVDEVQPVAMSLSPSGEVLDVTSWAEQTTPVTTKTRTIAAGEDRAFVRDWPTSLSAPSAPRAPLATVAIDVASDGQLSPTVGEVAEVPPQNRRDRHLRHTEEPHTIEEFQQDWTFRIHLTGVAWHSEAFHASERVDFPAPAEIRSQAVLDNVAAICVQRANKRPWPFHPDCDIQLLAAAEHGLATAQVPNPDIAHLCWPRQRDDLAVRRELGEYLDFALGNLDAAAEHGAREPQMIVHGTGLDTVIELRFRLDAFPETVLCRRDVPFDETGAVSGLRARNVVLDEDIEFSVLTGAFDTSGPVTRI
ncbi:hypothetical protein GCM10027174_26330 [Salinifilum aidingensis]